jgi:effector-binding domain-containing protein
MIDTPQIKEYPESHTAVISLKIPKEQMMSEFGPAIEEIFSVLGEQGVEASRPVFAHHFRMDRDVFDFEVGVPTDEPINKQGRVSPGKRPSMRVAHTIHHGPYEGLPEAWREFHKWLEAQDLAWDSDIWEVYSYGPAQDPDPTNWRTELNRPLSDT